MSTSSSKPSEASKNSNEPVKILAKDTGEEFIHKPAKNMSELKQTEKIAAKLKERKEKRELEARLLKVKKLADSDSDDDVKKWVSKSRKIQTEKDLAEKKVCLCNIVVVFFFIFYIHYCPELAILHSLFIL